MQLTLLILLIFVLFLMTATSISFQGDMIPSPSKVGEGLIVTGTSIKEERHSIKKEYTIIIQGDNTIGGKNIARQLDCLKKKYKIYRTMEDIPISMKEDINLFILCSSKTEGYYSYDDIIEASKLGIDIIFAVLPSGQELSQEWLDLLGIRYLGSRYTQKGIVCFDNFLVGGIRWYEDYKIRTLRIKTTSVCKTYVAGINDSLLQEHRRNEDATDIIWRTILNNSRIFVINGNFFTNMSHIGMLNAVLSKLNSDYLYPVINAKMLFIVDAPYLSNENEVEMERRYARNANRFLEEIAIPGIVSLSMALEIQPQFYGTAYFEDSSNGLSSHSVHFLDKELIKIGGDIQVSANQNKISKITKGIKVFESITGEKVTSILFQDNNTRIEKQIVDALSYTGNISSLIHDWNYAQDLCIKDNYAYIPMMTNGYDINDTILLQFDEAASSLGLITHGISMEDMIYPSSDKDDWSTAYKDFSASYYTACQKYPYLDGINATGLEQRVRQYLLMEPEVIYKKSGIYLEIENLYTQGFFILRTEKRIKAMSSGTYKELEEGVYLLTITSPSTEITLRKKKNLTVE